jgi:eukaryotic-like serine/threonine-protein kinase
MTRPDAPPAQRGGAAAAMAPAPPVSQASVAEGAVAAGGDLPTVFFLGRYRVVDEIGVGGMASVHLARVDGPGGFQKWVAIKRIHPHLVEDDQFVDMFLDEARIAAGINHANVAQVFDLGKDDNTYWIAMEYLHGEPLREVMRRIEEKTGRIPFHIAARICADAAEGLHAAHELRGRNGQLLNLVHRDVTPHNLFVTYEGYTKVVDFGIAKVIDRLASTRAGTLKGKLAYMSPEQVRGQEVDRRTDIFALGVVLWELTTNRRLFRMDTDLDTLEKVQACVVPLPSTIIPDYPPELQDLVMKALSQRKEDRFQTAREFSRALQRFLMKQGTFVGPEDVGDYIKSLFNDRVAKREKYLEWAAEVTSAVDLEELQMQAKQQVEANSLLHPTPEGGQAHAAQAPAAHAHGAASQGFGGPPSPRPSAPQPGSAPSQSHVKTRQPMQASFGEDSAAAAVVTSAPLADLASTSLMDEDEDIPTVVAQPRAFPELMGHYQGGGAGGAGGGFDSTIALPDDQHAGAMRARVDEMDRQLAASRQQHMAPLVPQTPLGPAVAPGLNPHINPHHNAQQGAIETKMSLPRPAAVAQWLIEQGDVEIQGPRSTGVIIAIAALATLCVMGVASLIVYKLQLPPQPDPRVAAVPTVTAPIEVDSKDSPEADGGKRKKGSKAKAAATDKDSKGAGKKKDAKKADDKPGELTVTCKPACDSIVAGGTSLGPSPVFNHPMPPGTHRVTLKGNKKTKTIMVQVISGQLTTQSVTMK